VDFPKQYAPVENKSKQFAQLLQAINAFQAFKALTQDERSALLKALGGVKSLQL
jgi:hypothetical protein